VLEWFGGHCEDFAGRDNLIFRYGGEEFVVLMPGADAQAGAKAAEKIRSRIEKASFRFEGIDLKVTLSCGVAVYPDHGADGDELVRKADQAMYKAKEAGRNIVVFSKTGSGRDTSLVPYEVKAATTPRGTLVESRNHRTIPGPGPAARTREGGPGREG